MKKNSKNTLQELKTIVLKKDHLKHIKGGDDAIGTQDVVDT